MKEYYIHNFKNHADTILKMGNLTLLTGMNGAGKSSVIQSMLLLRESYLAHTLSNSLLLKGDSVNLGMSGDVVNQNVIKNPDMLTLSITQNDGERYSFRYTYPLKDVSSLKAIEKINYLDDDINKISLFTDNFQYLSAFRNGPLTSYPSDTDVVDEHRQLSKKNGQGEYSVYYLEHFGNEELAIKGLAFDDIDSSTLREQTERWLDVICQGIVVKINQEGSSLKLSFGYKIKGKTNRF